MRRSRLKQLRALNGFGMRCFPNVHVILEYLQEYFTMFNFFSVLFWEIHSHL